MGDAIIEIAAVTQQIAQIAANVALVAPSAGATVRAAGKSAVPRPTAQAESRNAVREARLQRPEPVASDLRPIRIRCVGHTETGKAAWYGGRYVGRQTSSGDRLDTIHPTAAHRTLPLNSLALVTNLKNGRSVVVKVTDRGPISPTLLIDMSPRAAEQLAMKDEGVVPVKIEQVVEVPPEAQ
ncbi:MAG: septal ring lytic transglycosylase RlpA family protein [Alphaproteobacteria bacterium]|nr:septal ring lytic transglycosylase RlpA family protein [Alphaproteobacteria bacterium]